MRNVPASVREFPPLLNDDTGSIRYLILSIIGTFATNLPLSALRDAAHVLYHLTRNPNPRLFAVFHESEGFENIFGLLVDVLPSEYDSSITSQFLLDIHNYLLSALLIILKDPLIEDHIGSFAGLLCRAFDTLQYNDSLFALVVRNIAVLINFHYPRLDGKSLETICSLIPRLLAKAAYLLFPLLAAFSDHDPSKLDALLSMKCGDSDDDWLLGKLMSITISSGRSGAIVASLDFITSLALQNQISSDLIYAALPKEELYEISDPEAQRVFSGMLHALMRIDGRFHQEEYLARLLQLAEFSELPVKMAAMNALACNLPRFGCEAVSYVIRCGFLERFAEIYPTMSPSSEYVRALAHILWSTEDVNQQEMIAAFHELDLLSIVQERNGNRETDDCVISFLSDWLSHPQDSSDS
jgi:hypothetical protein